MPWRKMNPYDPMIMKDTRKMLYRFPRVSRRFFVFYFSGAVWFASFDGICCSA